jgi:butyryl-CoA dehydrogenase
MQGFGHVILAWIWLDVATKTWSLEGSLAEGKRSAMKYFFTYELPKIDAWLDVAGNREMICANMKSEWF